ncbi:MAG: lysophospholipid acyltransferase family protein [Acidimicrobiia bacterium]
MTNEPRYPIAFSRGNARVDDLRTWVGLTGASALLFGPLRWAILASGRLGRRHLLHRLERIWATVMTRALGIRVTVSGLDRVDADQEYVVVPLHEGLVDPLVITRIPLHLSFAARDELFDWRFLGSYLSASEQTSISTRSGPDGFRALLRGAQAAFDRNESFVVFPQGSILGVEAAFFPGPFRVAEKLGRPILPVVISGTHRVWEYPYRPIVRRHQRVRLEILDPIPADRSVESMRSTEREMKRIALSRAPFPRRYEPDRDGWWDEYPFRIDGDFARLAHRVRDHRSSAGVG